MLPTQTPQGKLRGAGDARLEQGKGRRWAGEAVRVPSAEPGAPAAGTSQASAQASGACRASAPIPVPFPKSCHFATSLLGDCLFLEEWQGGALWAQEVFPGPSWRCQTGAERVTAHNPVIHGSLSRTCGCTRYMGRQKTLLRPAQAAGAV